jgi:DNA-binding transcriptional LysR family regulator
VKITPQATLACALPELQVRTAIEGLGFLVTFEGYLTQAIKAKQLVKVLDDWCADFPGPFLYYPSRRQPPPSLSAFIAFVREWRKQNRS